MTFSQKNIHWGSYILLFCIVCISFGLVFFMSTMALANPEETNPEETKPNPVNTVVNIEKEFLRIEKELDAMADLIQQYPENRICNMYKGKELAISNTYLMTYENFIREQNENMMATTGHDRYKKMDKQIQEEIIDEFRIREIACSEDGYDRVYAFLSQHIEERKALYQLEINNPDPYDVNDDADPRKPIFEETSAMITRLKKNWAAISEAMNDMKDGEGEPSKSEYEDSHLFLTQKEYDAVIRRAQNRAQAYTQSFADEINNAFYSPMYTSRSTILSRLQKLPEGNSQEDTFSWAWDKEMKNSDAKKKADEQLQDHIDTFQDQLGLYQSIDQKWEIEIDVAKYEQLWNKLLAITRTSYEYDQAMGNSMMHALQPFHQTLIDTTPILKAQTKALKNVNERQNIQ